MSTTWASNATERARARANRARATWQVGAAILGGTLFYAALLLLRIV